MSETLNIIFAASLLVTLCLSAVSWVPSKNHGKSFVSFTLLGLALGQLVLFHFIDQSLDGRYLGLAMVGWLWPVFALRRVLETIGKQELGQRWNAILLGTGAFVSLALASYGVSFLWYSLPFVLSYCVLGFTLLSKSWRPSNSDLRSPGLASLGLFFAAVYFTNRLLYPLWRTDADFLPYGYLLDLASFLGVGFSFLFKAQELHHERSHEELKKLGEEQNEKLLGTSKYSELGMMSAGIAHEINNPLAVIQARTTQLLRIYKDPAKSKELGEGLEQIIYTSERINRTIQGVREFVHQDDKALPQELSLKVIVDDVLTFCGQRMKNHGVNLRFYGLENFRVRGNKIQLEQVILNLLNNSFDAIEFLPDKWIELSVQQEGDWLQIFVKDSGSGIPQEVAERIMDPFYSTKDIGKGTGLGLALAKGIVEKHGGHLLYLKERSHTTFMMELPRPPDSLNAWGSEMMH